MRITTAYLGELGLDSFKGENKMGRPVKKSRFGNTAGDFEVSGAFSTESTQPDGTGAEAVSTATGN